MFRFILHHHSVKNIITHRRIENWVLRVKKVGENNYNNHDRRAGSCRTSVVGYRGRFEWLPRRTKVGVRILSCVLVCKCVLVCVLLRIRTIRVCVVRLSRAHKTSTSTAMTTTTPTMRVKEHSVKRNGLDRA